MTRTASYRVAVASLGFCFLATVMSGCETADPDILGVTELQDTAGTLGPYQVTAQVVGIPDEIVVELHYQVDGAEEYIRLKMTWIGGHTWHGAIPGQPVGSTIAYYVAVARADALNKPITLPSDAPETTFQFSVIDGN